MGPGIPAQGDGAVPERVALELRTCTLAHEDHLAVGHARYSISFDVRLADDGQVDAVKLRDSTLEDEPLEACMASALRVLSEDDLLLRRGENLPRLPSRHRRCPGGRRGRGVPQGRRPACAGRPDD